MPTYQTAKTIAEDALSTIGAFPASQDQADEGELKKSLRWLEMVLNNQSGVRPTAGFWNIIDIPIEADIGDYQLSDYADSAEVQHVFSVNLVHSTGDVDPITMIYDSESVLEDLKETGTPNRVSITRDVKPVMRVFPKPVQSNQDAGQVLRLRIQTYHPEIDNSGIADSDLSLRPSWYLWVTKRLAYEIGSGPVRKIGEGELSRLRRDAREIEDALLARDGQYQSGSPPVTEAYGHASITYYDKDEIALNNYSRGRGYSRNNRNGGR